MSLKQSPCKDEIIAEARRLGFYKIGFAKIRSVEEASASQYADWISVGCHGEMCYLDRYHDVRNNPQLLLPSAKTIIVCAASYYPTKKQSVEHPQIAIYALGRDYHEVLRERLTLLADFVGGETRVCVDTAPLRERYWAVQAGVGFVGRNSQLIIPDAGSYFFLGEILTSIEFPADTPLTQSCLECGRCVDSCPGNAITGNGAIDARRCLSYLTIEYKGDFPAGFSLGNHLYGCDECQAVCPHNSTPIFTSIPDFDPSEELLSLDKKTISELTPERFSTIFRHSAIKRTKLTGLLRNLNALD